MQMRPVRIGLLSFLFPTLVLAADPPWIARSSTGMVATDSPAASQVGADILADGGNAFDAAIATSLALAVTRPQSTGLGGGGFLVAFVAKDNGFVVLDFREVAPAAATAERYQKLNADKGNGPSPSIYGGHAIGVPGQLAGLAEVHKRFATRPLAELAAPAIRLAEAGFAVDEYYENACKEALADFARWPKLKEQYPRLYETLLGAGTPPKPGDTLKRPDLARGLRLIAEQGPDAIYRGPVGQAIAKAARAAGGALTEDDLAQYHVRERAPLRAPYHDYEIITMPPPSSGGVCMIETLNILDVVAIDFGGLRGMRDDLYPPFLVLALKHAFADRSRWLGDPDFAPVPIAQLTSRKYAAQLAHMRLRSENIDEYGSTTLPEDRGTSHFCVADKAGNVVALTETINGVFGSLVVAEPYGIILNNQMDDFAADPGKPNLYGLIQGPANAVAPGKRPLSSMSPTIVMKDGKPVLVLGASGGPRIITSVLQVLLNVIVFEMPLEAAQSAVRIHDQWQPDEVFFDRAPPEELAQALREAGFKLSAERRTGIVQAIQFLPDGTLIGASDPRRGGRPVGVKTPLQNRAGAAERPSSAPGQPSSGRPGVK